MSWNKTEELGSVVGMRFMLFCLRVFGLRIARFVSEFVILYFFLTKPRVRAASRDYLRRVAAHPDGCPSLPRNPNLWTSWLHVREFGRGVLDRACFWAGMGDRFEILFPARAEFLRLQQEKRGAILLGAHLGTIDVLRAIVAKKSFPVNSMIFREKSRKLNSVLSSVDANLESRIIQVDLGLIQSILNLKECVDRGELVAILGDRPELASEKRTLRAQFLGGVAAFPVGALLAAHLLQCPVYILFALKRSPDSYEICLEPFAERILLDRGRRDLDLQSWLERYVRRLETQCLSTPLQWFNFYDFWRTEESDAPEGVAPARTSASPALREQRAGRS